MSRFLNPQWLQRWHLSKVQQKPHSLIISLAARTGSETANQRASETAKILNFCPFPRESDFTTSFFIFFFHSSSFLVFLVRLARIPQAARERAMQTSHQPCYSLLSLIMALIPSRWINIFIPSPLEPEGSSTLESKKERERKKWRVEEGAQERDDRWKGGSMSENEPTAK